MSTPTDTPSSTPVSLDVEAATKMLRTKAFVKKSFTRVGVPILVATATVLVLRKRGNSESTDDTVSDEK